MKLTKVFQTKSSALREAFQKDDLVLMEKLMGKKSDFLVYDLFKSDVAAPITPRMADLFVQKISEGTLIRWSAGAKEMRLLPVTILAAHALEDKNYAVLDVLFDGRIDYCKDKTASSIINHLIKADVDPDKQAGYLKKLLSQSTKLPDPDKAVKEAIEAGNTAALDILAASGIDLHEKNEYWLREAAKLDKKHVCLHLIENRGADIAHAQKTAEELGTHSVFVYLESLRGGLKMSSAAEEPPTIESLSREVKELRTAMREMTALVQEMRAERTIDKTVDKPGLRAKGNTP